MVRVEEYYEDSRPEYRNEEGEHDDVDEVSDQQRQKEFYDVFGLHTRPTRFKWKLPGLLNSLIFIVFHSIIISG